MVLLAVVCATNPSFWDRLLPQPIGLTTGSAFFSSVIPSACCAQDNERAKECRYATKAVAAYKERAAESLRARLDSDDDLPTSRRLLRHM